MHGPVNVRSNKKFEWKKVLWKRDGGRERGSVGRQGDRESRKAGRQGE